MYISWNILFLFAALVKWGPGVGTFSHSVRDRFIFDREVKIVLKLQKVGLQVEELEWKESRRRYDLHLTFEMWRFQRSRKKKADSISVERVHYFDLNQIQTIEFGHWGYARVIHGYSARKDGKSLPASPVHKLKKKKKGQGKACSNSAWLISCKFFKDLKRAPSTWKVWLISSILQFTTTQLISKMLAHLVRRSNLSTGMNTKSLVPHAMAY